MKPDTRKAPLDLWRIVARYLTEMFNLFGAPEQIARGRVLSKQMYDLLMPWLRGAEALARRLLLIEASLLAVSPSRPKTSPVQQRKTPPAPRPFHDMNPDNWRASFQCSRPPGKRSRGRKRGAKPPPRSHVGAWPIALRCEAVLRVFNNPGPYAARLARRLRATPALLQAALKCSPKLAHLVGHEDFARIASALDDVPAYNSS
jgi:hypothetical protein